MSKLRHARCDRSKQYSFRFADAEEGAINPSVLDGVSLDIEAGSFVAVLDTTVPASPPLPST